MKKGVFGPGVWVVIILGLLFIGIVVFGVGPQVVKYVNEKWFGGVLTPNEPSLPGMKVGKGEVPKIELPSGVAAAERMLSVAVIECWRSFQQSGFADQVCFEVVPPEKFSTQTGLGYNAIQDESFIAYLSTLGELGKDLSGVGVLNAQEVTWNLGGRYIEGGDAPFWVCADDDMGNEIVLTREPESGDCH